MREVLGTQAVTADKEAIEVAVQCWVKELQSKHHVRVFGGGRVALAVHMTSV